MLPQVHARMMQQDEISKCLSLHFNEILMFHVPYDLEVQLLVHSLIGARRSPGVDGDSLLKVYCKRPRG